MQDKGARTSHFDEINESGMQKSGYGRIGGAKVGHYRQSYRKYHHPNGRNEEFCNLI
jgi:hypothetical protein